MSRYDADDVYCIPGTAVLKNKAGITDQDLLDEYEGDFTAIRLLELTQNPIQGSFDLAHLCKIHSYLFQDVYEWAGEVRSVDIIRGDSRFCNVRQIQSYSHTIFSALATEKYLVNLEPAVFANRLAHYLSEVNAIHPFREGNGSIWLQQYVSPVSIPTMVDHYSGEPIVSITDHYRVLDWNILARALQDCANIDGDRSNGWTRIMDCEDGQRRPSLSINPGKKPDQIEVFYTTQAYADQGRSWLEGLAGDALAMLTRKVSDPASWAQRRNKPASADSRPPSMPSG